VQKLKHGNWFVLGDPVKGSLALLNDVAEAEREISQRRPKHFRIAKDLAHAQKMLNDARAKHRKEQMDARAKATDKAKAKRKTPIASTSKSNVAF
jgi:DNA-directed RNA polymerase beta' subunit